MENVDALIREIKEMATKCRLENCEQICEINGAIGAVRMITREYLDLKENYLWEISR